VQGRRAHSARYAGCANLLDSGLGLCQSDFEGFGSVMPALRQAQDGLRRASGIPTPRPGFPLSRE
jgi:hypothetical protein